MSDDYELCRVVLIGGAPIHKVFGDVDEPYAKSKESLAPYAKSKTSLGPRGVGLRQRRLPDWRHLHRAAGLQGGYAAGLGPW